MTYNCPRHVREPVPKVTDRDRFFCASGVWPNHRSGLKDSGSGYITGSRSRRRRVKLMLDMAGMTVPLYSIGSGAILGWRCHDGELRRVDSRQMASFCAA